MTTFPMVAVHDGGNGIAVVDWVVFKAGGHREGGYRFNETRNSPRKVTPKRGG